MKLLEYAIFAFVAGGLLLLGPRAIGSLSTAPSLLAWLVVIAVSDLLPVYVWGGSTFGPSLPILLAAGMLFSPVIVGLLAILGATDIRELHREVTLPRALYNRSLVAICAMAASLVFHALNGSVRAWPAVLAIAVLALLTDALVNILLIVLMWRVGSIGSSREAIVSVIGERPIPFLLSYTCLGLIALILAVLYTVVGDWALAAFLIPVLLGRQALIEITAIDELARAISEKTRVLLHLSEKMADERRDERLSIAAGLHDELLPPLYKVHLLGQVLRHDLASGRLLNLEDDLPELLGATEHASLAIQALIRDLRRSPVAPGGLLETIRLLVRDVQSTSSLDIRLEAEEVGGSPLVQLLAYQVVREALRNSVRHAHARTIRIAVRRDGLDMRLLVEDDGAGFDPRSVDEERHFGLQLMRERVELSGGVLHLESTIGRGTRILVRLPAETSIETN